MLAGRHKGCSSAFHPNGEGGSVAKADGERKGALLCLRSQEAEALLAPPRLFCWFGGKAMQVSAAAVTETFRPMNFSPDTSRFPLSFSLHTEIGFGIN